MKKYTIVLSIIFLGSLFLAGAASADQLTNPIPGANDLKTLIIAITTAVAGIIGAATIIMFVLSGIIFLTAAGSPERVNTAKACLLYAIIGTIVAISAGAIATTITSLF